MTTKRYYVKTEEAWPLFNIRDAVGDRKEWEYEIEIEEKLAHEYSWYCDEFFRRCNEIEEKWRIAKKIREGKQPNGSVGE